MQPRPMRQPAQRERPMSLVKLPRPTTDDAALVAGLLEGRPAAAGELFDRFEPIVRRLLIRMLGGTRDLDDLVQDTFLTIIRRCPTLRDPSALRSFVVSVTIRTARAELRKRRVWQWVGLEAELDPPTTPAHDAVVAQGIRRVYDVLKSFDVTSRLAFVLRRVEGYELTETAEACGCSLATIKRKLARAEERFESVAKADPVLRSFLGEEPAT